MTMFGLNVERVVRRRTPEEDLSPEAALMAELKPLLPPEACVFAGAAAPMIVVCHRGRALGLHLMARDGKLSHAETNAFIVLRAAGMRIEVARDGTQAKAMLREMGVPLREEARHSLRDVFREQLRRR
ncbi:MAG TPA: hypothetical protein VFA87_06795 [Rhizomicrobium sp.]|nr:hypothetical protein [Rhizomicrobium sp.]